VSFYRVSLSQALRVTGLQRQGSDANWNFDEGCPKSYFIPRGLHEGFFLDFTGKVVLSFFVHELSAHGCSGIRALD